MTILKAVSAAMALIMATIYSANAAPDRNTEGTVRVFQFVNTIGIAAVDGAIERFGEKYPNVTIEPQYVPFTNWGEYISAFFNQMATGNPPDVFISPIEGFSEVARHDLLIDLDEIVESDDELQDALADIDPNLLAGMRSRPSGKLNFYPMQWQNVVMYYNKSKFDEAGIPYPAANWTWADFLETSKALTKRDSDGHATQYAYIIPSRNFMLQPWFITNDASVLDDEWRNSTVTDPNFQETLQFLHDLIHDHGVATAFDVGDDVGQFAAGQVAMISAGHWPAPSLLESGMEGNVGVQIMPTHHGEGTVYGIAGASITQSSQDKELALEFLKELTGETYQKFIADNFFGIPSSRMHATTAEYLRFPDNAEIFYGSAATAKPVASPPNFSQVEEIFLRKISSYLNGSTDLDTTISELDAEISRSMSRAYDN